MFIGVLLCLLCFLGLLGASRLRRIPLKHPRLTHYHHNYSNSRRMKPLLLQDRKVFHWVDTVFSEAMTVDEPDMPAIDKTLLVLDEYYPDRTMVAFLNRLLGVAREKRLDWLIEMLRRFARLNGIPMTQTWRSGLQIREPSRPLPK